MRSEKTGVAILLLLPSMFIMAVLFVGPLIIFLQYSFYSTSGGKIIESFTLNTYLTTMQDPFFWKVMFSSVKLATLCTILSLVIGYPTAYAISRISSPLFRTILQAIIFVPVATSAVVRIYGWMVIFADGGVLSFITQKLGVLGGQTLKHTTISVLTGMTHFSLPFAVFPILSILVQLGRSPEEAASDLGASNVQILRHVVFPMSIPGVLAAIRMLFPFSLAAFAAPNLLGGGFVLTIPGQIYNDMLMINWPAASVAGVILLIICAAAMYVLEIVTRRYYVTGN